jgi:hypothetical protein
VGAAPAGVDHQVGADPLDRLVRCGAAGAHVDAHDPPGFDGQRGDLHARAHVDVRQGEDHLAGGPLDQIPAGGHQGPTLARVRPHPARGREPGEVAGQVDGDAAGGHQRGLQPREQALQGRQAAGLQGVGVAGLGDARTRHGGGGEVVALEDRDAAGVACDGRSCG